jgi:hypothetical protein
MTETASWMQNDAGWLAGILRALNRKRAVDMGWSRLSLRGTMGTYLHRLLIVRNRADRGKGLLLLGVAFVLTTDIQNSFFAFLFPSRISWLEILLTD